MLLHEKLAQNTLSGAMQTIVDNLVQDHFDTATQEHQLTSRIGQAFETFLNDAQIWGHKISVITQDIPDKGPGSMESKTGSDLYIGIQMQGDEFNICKGLLIQSKWDDKLTPSEQRRLSKQCEIMRNISDKGSFVWIYGARGTQVISASEIADNKQTKPRDIGSKNLDDFFHDVFDCFSGDTNKASPEIFNDRKKLEAYLNNMEAIQPTTAIALKIDTRVDVLKDSKS